MYRIGLVLGPAIFVVAVLEWILRVLHFAELIEKTLPWTEKIISPTAIWITIVVGIIIFVGAWAERQQEKSEEKERGEKQHMATPELWLEVLAGLKALSDGAQRGTDYATSVQQHRQEPETIAESRRASATSTYSERELKDLIRRIEGCRDRFILQGSGADRTRCLCSIFNEIRDGNGGTLPRIDDWDNMYDQLRCGIDRR